MATRRSESNRALTDRPAQSRRHANNGHSGGTPGTGRPARRRNRWSEASAASFLALALASSTGVANAQSPTATSNPTAYLEEHVPNSVVSGSCDAEDSAEFAQIYPQSSGALSCETPSDVPSNVSYIAFPSAGMMRQDTEADLKKVTGLDPGDVPLTHCNTPSAVPGTHAVTNANNQTLGVLLCYFDPSINSNIMIWTYDNLAITGWTTVSDDHIGTMREWIIDEGEPVE